MSSLATAPTRIEEPVWENPEAPAEAPAAAPATAPAAAPLDEVQRVERLLTQLEARSMALVPYNYGALREVPVKKPLNTGLIAGTLVAIWFSSLVLAVTYIRYNHSTPAVERPVAAAAPLIIPAVPDPQEQKVASSVDHLAKALVTSSERLNQLEAEMERSNRDLQHLANKITEPKPVVTSPKTAPMEINAPVMAVEGTVPKNWHRVLDIKPADSAVAHRTADGSIDYWLVPRGAERTPAKVLPIGSSPDGVVVHSLDDGKDYTLTPLGEWRSGPATPSGN